MTDEKAKAFAEKLEQIVEGQTARLDDPPRLQLTGEPIPEELLKNDKQE